MKVLGIELECAGNRQTQPHRYTSTKIISNRHTHTLFVHQQVAQLQVAMEHKLGVQMRHRAQQLQQNAFDLGLAERPLHAVHQRGKVVLAILERQKDAEQVT